mmetsp:Transcript_40573/g.41259  ORF Transcript_40573/g.41259 Transcript_40573/m.41259 type:complete len:82 (-) Transcript_40573:776-1021(-)
MGYLQLSTFLGSLVCGSGGFCNDTKPPLVLRNRIVSAVQNEYQHDPSPSRYPFPCLVYSDIVSLGEFTMYRTSIKNSRRVT